jgi:IclR family KDG regulon transcriptional repressor
MREQNDYNVRAVERAIQILDSFDDDHPERGVTEISELVDLHKATTHRILTTLLNYGYIERSSDGLKYKLGVKLIDLGFRVRRRMDVRKEAMPYISLLAQQLDESVDLSIFDQGQVLYTEMIQSNHALMIAASVGRHLPLHCTASGKIFLAYLPIEKTSDLLSAPFAASTKNTITDPDVLRKHLNIIREEGCAVDNEELELGVRAVAAPIFDSSRRIVAAVSIPGPVSRITEDRIPEIKEALKRTTNTISSRLGYLKS